MGLKNTGTSPNIKEMTVSAFELCLSYFDNEKMTMDEIRNNIAVDLLVSQMALEIDQTGTIDEEKLKERIKELF